MQASRAVRGCAHAPNSTVFSRTVAAPPTPLLSLHWLRDDMPARLGLAVSRKVDPHAVGRNRIKRVLRAQFRLLRPQLPTGAYVLVARSAAAKVEAAMLRNTFLSLLRRAGALPMPGADGTMPAAPHPRLTPPPLS